MVEEPQRPKRLCDIIVPTYNKLEYTQAFVKSFIAQTTTPARVIFVDNGSGDGSREFLSTLSDTDLHSFTVILNNENKGYVLGMNQGLQVSDAPYVCFCNNDVIFTRGWLEEVILTFKEYPDVGLLNPNSNNLNYRPKEKESIDSFADRLKRTYTKGAFIDTPFCIGFCLLVRRHIIDQIGGFSEEYVPMFFEDSDYSRRVQKAGYRLGIARRAYVWHHEHGSMDQLGPKKEEYFKKSQAVYLKNWGRTLRIAWVIEDYKELLKVLDKGVELGYDANYIFFWVKDLEKEAKQIFKEANVPPFSDVKFLPFEGDFAFFWKALTKKKKYDLVITPNKRVRSFLKLFRQNATEQLDPALIQELKFKGV